MSQPEDNSYPVRPSFLPTQTLVDGRYEARFATDPRQLDALLKLRFEVFNLELGEGLEESYATGRDRDVFDSVCHHLIVVDRASQQTVGTYRMQTGEMADAYQGFYSAGEFDLGGLTSEVLESSVEVGRACVARDHRNTHVLFLLWRGLARYMAVSNHRYLFGCCSLTSQDPAEGRAVMTHLEDRGHVHPSLRIMPKFGLECYSGDGERASFATPVHLPQLFRIYLRHGAKVCGPPAIDREFKTIDYLVLFDVATMNAKQYRTFFGT